MKTIANLDELELELFLRRREHCEIIWKTEKGDEIPIRNMSDTHLENTIKMIKRNEKVKLKNEDMKVWINKRMEGYSGGLAIVAAHSAAEAHAILATDERTKCLCDEFNYKTKQPETNPALFDSYAYHPEHWEELEGVEAHFGKPQLIAEDGYSE